MSNPTKFVSGVAVEREDMADFICGHDYWLDIDEVYANVRNQKPVTQ